MLKRQSSFKVLITFISLLVFVVSCKSKPTTSDTEAPVGGTEGQQMDSAIDSKNMSFDAAGSDSGSIPGLKTIHFDFDSATLGTEARRQLAENAEWIKTNSAVTVQVEGHCDARGSVEYNLALGERRAKSVKNYLVGLGVDAKRMTIISYGEEKPLVAGDTESAFAQNRRANFVPLAQ